MVKIASYICSYTYAKQTKLNTIDSLFIKILGPISKTGTMPLGKMQDLMTEALDGFVLVLLGDGTIAYLSDNIHKYLGLSQVFASNVSMYGVLRM